jgi:hypothetical protein
MSMPAGPGRRQFMLACAGGFASFAAGGCFFSLATPIMFDALPWRGPIVMGLAYLPMAFICLALQILHGHVEPFKGFSRGLTSLMVAGLCAVVGGLSPDTAAALFAGLAFLALGQGYTIMCCTVIANRAADAGRRAANMSTYFLCTYLGACGPVFIAGRVADHAGLPAVVTGYGAVMAAGVLTLLLVSLRQAKLRSR